ncbi:MAG TPA: HEAT repeat domain-containing protein [Rhizomicrobium sp.]|jgi:HEAT repeat protein|nr:HEAT repeat domain-containing protein [Rhizomicrobium sp.]
MTGKQLDLFAGPMPATAPDTPSPDKPAVDAAALSDAALIAAIAEAGIGECHTLAREAARRRLAAGVPVLKALCQRHAGFGGERMVPQQAAALDALAAIGGREASRAVGDLVRRGAVGGPGLKLAVAAAARLDSPLPEEIVASLLRHDDPQIRAAAARCARTWPRTAPILIELLDDLHREVSIAAACALGRMGRAEARVPLLRALRDEPSEEIIDAAAGVGDEEFIVLLGRTAANRPDLARTVLEALEPIEHPLAAKVATRIRAAEDLNAVPGGIQNP